MRTTHEGKGLKEGGKETAGGIRVRAEEGEERKGRKGKRKRDRK